jgi:hypothetical protein
MPVSNGFVAALARRRLRAVVCVCNVALSEEPGMSRCLSLFGLMFFALGLVALSSVKADASQPTSPQGPASPPRKTPGNTPMLNAPRYLVQFSLN